MLLRIVYLSNTLRGKSLHFVILNCSKHKHSHQLLLFIKTRSCISDTCVDPRLQKEKNYSQLSGKRKKIQRIGHSLKFYIIKKKKKNPHELVQSSPWIKKGKPSSFHEAILGHCTLESREGSLKGANTINVLAFAIFLNPGDKSGNFMSAGMRTIKAKWVAC